GAASGIGRAAELVMARQYLEKQAHVTKRQVNA
ncbi:hypothetical protein LCGC14_2600240, partial [marine sediment metagenome]